MKVAVIGGGISGIATAYYLTRKLDSNSEIHLFESSGQLGGRICSQEIDQRWIDFGGKNIGKNYHRFRALVEYLGLTKFENFGLNTSQQLAGKTVQINREKGLIDNLLGLYRLCGARGLLSLFPFVFAIWRDPEQGYLNTHYFNNLKKRSKTLDAVFGNLTQSDILIEDEFNFGRQVGVTGTPAIMLANGMMVPGYQEPNKLLMLLQTAL